MSIPKRRGRPASQKLSLKGLSLEDKRSAVLAALKESLSDEAFGRVNVSYVKNKSIRLAILDAKKEATLFQVYEPQDGLFPVGYVFAKALALVTVQGSVAV